MENLVFSLTHMIRAAETTLGLAIVCIFLSTIIGLVLGISSVLAGKVLSVLIRSVIYVVRGIPILVQLFLVYFGLPFFNILVDPYTVAALAISLHISAFVSEIVRGSIISLPKAQTEGGLALGLMPSQVVRWVTFPQALKSALPPYISLTPITIKATSLASIISIWELTLASKEVANQTMQTFEVFGIAFALYFIICFPFTWFGSYLEKRLTGYHF
jgi:His/Glu/Gln/Arg/opine family amino acid ABC transporter permease subunit